MNEIAEKTVAQEFAEFVKVNGPSFIYGHIVAPYDGCFYLNGIAFVDGEYAYATADLSRMSRYKGCVVTPPNNPAQIGHECKSFRKVEELTAGCIKVEAIEDVLSGPRSDGLEFHPISELVENTPYSLYKQVITMAAALKLDIKGQFKCACCGSEFSAGEDLFYLESEFKGNGGIGIEVGAPVCMDCYCQHKCGYCGEECAPELASSFGEDHCQWCAPAFTCACGEMVQPSLKGEIEDNYVAAYNAGKCQECYEKSLKKSKKKSKK